MKIFQIDLIFLVRNDFYGLVSSLERFNPELFESEENATTSREDH